MGHISTLFIEKLAELAAPKPGADEMRQTLYRVVDIDPEIPPDPSRMITDTAFFGLLEHIAAEVEDGRSIAIRLGANMRCDDYGAFGLAFKSALDLLGSFKRVERYGKVVTSIANFTIESRGQSSFIAVRPDQDRRLGLRMTKELAVSAATALSREVHPGDFSPIEVSFSHEAPEDLSMHELHFRCPVRYSAGSDGLEISDEVLRAGNRLGDARISEFFDSHLDRELEKFAGGAQLEREVCSHIANALSEGTPKVADIARRMGLSGRTLQRRLAAEGRVFQDLVDGARRDLADKLLRRTDFALAEIAFLTGYSEQSTFTRAFKRWHGQTPASFRRAAVNS